MKVKTCKAAHNLSVHPSRVLQHMAELAESLTFPEVWPEIDEEWVETLFALEHHGTISLSPAKRDEIGVDPSAETTS